MNILSFAEQELDIIGMTGDSEDEINLAMRKHILHMVKEFSDEGHSGFSAPYAVSILQKLLMYEPLTPLTGEDSEWVDLMDDGSMLQNKRCSHVFKDSDGRAYDIQGIVFYDINVDEDGKEFRTHFTSRDSRVYIEFPYTPSTIYIEADPNRE